jgi:hypothetical protein
MKITPKEKIDKDIFKKIFLDHWPSFKEKYPKYDDPQYTIPVQKMLDCGKESGGYTEYRCVYCGLDAFLVGFSCKSSFCLSCSKLYVDEFVMQVSKMLHPDVVYRHIVLTLPEQLRQPFYSVRHDGSLLSRLMKTGHQCLEEVVSVVLRKNVKIGTMIVVQTHGRSGHYNPHLHIIMTSGGIKEDIESWFDLRYFKYEIIHKKWQYHLFRMVKDWFQDPEINKLIDELWKKYPNGLVANVSKGNVPEGGAGLARYLAKYVASPPIAVRRIIDYDGSNVTYWYNDHKTKSRQVETVSTEVFIGRMVQHILPKGFQRIRYYGLQSTKTFKKWSDVILKGIKAIGRAVKGTYRIIRVKKYKDRYLEVSTDNPWLCKYCGNELMLWAIWHPKYGMLFDEYEKIKNGSYPPLMVDGEDSDDRGGGCTVRATPGTVQLSLFPMPA